MEELTPCGFHNCKQGDKEPLQEYMQCIIKMRARAPKVADLSVIKATINGLRIGPCQDYLDSCKPRTVGELFDIMQEYCKSDRGRRRIDAMNQEKKARTNQWSHPKPWHVDQLKQHNQRPVNTVLGGPEPHDFHGPSNKGGRSTEGAVLLYSRQGQRTLDKRMPLHQAEEG
ncbi:retrotransposon protein [Panicum miliaceum]|uniref:Retrotransposon protein n=1 Tax=Panicum miliaceum TaxID=4540 RepID=A0A3L6THZ5_PANMI|nr:retrotransposon protein [Panicum miliaceum]